ncbi:MAG: 30S ribosomal protein S1 [Candidatus Zixiibacteriota bacterium]|nr:MAG: 30S ribosomal protein S1 [candidate division Zixibacteria bacterium]
MSFNPETNEPQQEASPETPPSEESTQPQIPAPVPPPVFDDGPERVIHISELKDEAEYDPEEVAFMSRLYEDTMREIKSGEIVTGKIVSISEKDVAIDIGFKSEGTVSIDEFDDPSTLNIGDAIEVFLESIEDQEGELVLSKKRADFARVWTRILDIYAKGDTVQGKCLRRIKGGIVVDVMAVEAFLPGSQIDVHPVRDFDSWIGKTEDFRIVKVNEMRKNIVLSRKVLIEENLRDVRERILSEIHIGQVMEGQVKNITDFGAFVDLGGVDGLLHITDLSWGRINHPSEVVAYDQRLKVRVLDFDPVRKRISIGLKQLQPHPWEGIEKRFPIGSRVKGKVVSITKYGAFVELEEGIEGLIHISEMSWTQHIKHPAQVLNIGQEVEVVALSIDAENRKISLGLKQTEEDPWEKLEQKYAVGTRHTGTVRDLVPFGAFVELEEGIEGLVHISDLSWTRKIKHPGEVVKKSDKIEVVILSFDRNERRIALGHKQTLENPWEKFSQDFPVGSLIEGKVARTVDKGAIIELPLGLEGFLPVSQFGKDSKSGRGKALKEGEPLRLEVLEFDKDNKKIILSAASAQRREEESEYRAYLEQQQTTAPIGEAVTLPSVEDTPEAAPEAEAAPEPAPEPKKAKRAPKEKAPEPEAQEAAPEPEAQEAAPEPEAQEAAPEEEKPAAEPEDEPGEEPKP